jgi:hypothetical protein
MYFGYPTINTSQIIADASNIKTGDNPTYVIEDFTKVYPQFTSGIISDDLLQMHIDLADSCIKSARWKKSWKIAMGLFIAHWCTLWLRTSASSSSDKDAIAQAAQVQGIITSESVDGVSYSMDIGTALNDLQGYAGWKTTEYGVQLATLAKMYGKGAMLVW